MTGDRNSAPKADALPGCATPRLAEVLRFRALLTQGPGAFVAAVGGTRREQAARVPEYSRTATRALGTAVLCAGLVVAVVLAGLAVGL